MTNVTIPNIADACMLAYCSISVWSARKLDKKQTQKTITAAGATNDAARVNKHLLANADAALKEVQRKANQIRDYIDTNTVPWDDAGNRLLPNARALVVVGKLRDLEVEFDKTVDDFVAQYPVLRAQAVANLGDMGEDSDYPQPDVVRSKFSIKVSFSPVPKDFGDVRVGMSEKAAVAWQQHYEGNVQRQVGDALRAAWGRLRESLERYSDRLQLDEEKGKTKVFRDTMVSQLRETVDLLASLNVFGDATLERLTREVRERIAGFDAEVLRSNVGVAMSVKQSTDEILSKLHSTLGQ
jgi:hypothetical protein